MPKTNYYSEGKYRCNHPESDFEQTSTNPIELKRENFVEYTHRNETANYRYNVWDGNNNVTPTSSFSDFKGYANSGTYKGYSENKPNSFKGKKNSSVVGVVIFIFLVYFLPIVFSIIGAIVSMLNEFM